MISRSGRWPWRTTRCWPVSVFRSACFARNSATSASTAWVSSARAPRGRISVRESVKAPGWASLMTLLSDTAYHSFIGEVEALNTTTIRRLTRSRRHQLLAIARKAEGRNIRHRSSILLTITSTSDSVKHLDVLAGIGPRPPSHSAGRYRSGSIVRVQEFQMSASSNSTTPYVSASGWNRSAKAPSGRRRRRVGFVIGGKIYCFLWNSHDAGSSHRCAADLLLRLDGGLGRPM